MCKRIIVIMLMLVVLGVMQADAQQLNYQAIARNANGVALTFRDVGIRLSIRDGSPNGSIVYSESRNIRTNQFGLFTVIIGSPGASNVLGSMASINWISGNKYLQVEIDPEGGTNYFQAGTSQLQAVPYALFANAAYPVGPAGGDLLGSTYPNPIIAPLAVTTGKIANQAITTPKIADLNVTTPKLADQAVTNAKIQDNTIANIKLVNSRVTLNGLILNLGDAQDFAIGTNGIDVNIVSAGNTHTFNFPDASIANRGLITPNAQTIGGNKTFNNDITAARIIRAGGLAAQFLKADGSVDNNIYLTENQPIIVTATGDATGVSTSSRTAPVLPLTLATVNSAVGTYGTNIVVPSITVNNKGLVTNVIANPIPTATAITSGLLTVGDWNIFNNKQNAIPLGSATQYFRGDLTLSNFQTDVRNQLSAGTNITYANGNIGLTNNSVTLNTLPLTLGGSQTFATGTTGVDFNISSAGSVHTFNIPNASVFARGLISSTDYTNFNAAYTNRITSLTTTGTSGTATLSGNVLNIPNYTIAGLGGENTIVPGTTLQYWRGDKTWQTLNSSIVPEGTNFYYTDTRSRNALSITTSGSNGAATYNSALGVFNIPAYTLNGLGGVPSSRLINGLDLSADRTFSTSDIAEGSRQYFTDARARTSISLTTVGTGGLSTYDNTTGVLNIPNYTVTGLGAEPSITAGNALQYWRGDKTWQTLNTTVVPEGTNEYFTQAKARSSISLTTTGTSGSAVYSPATGILNVPSYTLGGLGGETAITPGNILEFWRGDKTWQTLNTTVVPEGTNQYFTQAKSRTSISLTTTGTNGAAAYDNTTGVLNIPNYTVTGLGAEPSITAGNALQYWRGDKTWQTLNTTVVPEGTNEYFTQAKARSSISLTTTGTSGSAVYSPATGILNVPSYTLGGLGGETAITPGNILEYWRGDKTWQTLNTTVVPEGTNQYFTQAKARTSISLTTAGTNGPAAYDNTTGALNVPAYTLAGLGGVPSSRQINGVDLSSDRTFTTTEINEGTNLYFNNTRARSAISLTTTGNSGQAVYNNITGILNIPEYTIGGLGGVSTARTINGIDLSANQTFAVGTAGTTFNISNAGTVHSFNIPNSSTALVTGGLLSNTDWTTFNNKQNAISGTGYGKWAGSTISFIPQIPLGTDVTGTLLAGNFGALTGDVTNTAGSYATTISNDAITTAKILNGSVTNDKIADGTVSNAKLTNNSFTLGSTSISLGSTTTTIAGLTLTSPTINTPAINYTNTSPITAGANTQGSLNITTDHNIILTAAASSAVTLPVGIEGRRITIVNRGANPVNVYPAAGGQINTLGTNAVFSNIPASSYAEFYATSSTQWYSANSIATATSSWNILGNAGINESTNFIGTTDANTLKFRVANTFAGQINKSLTVGNTSFGFDSNDSDGAGDFNSAFGSFALNGITVGNQNSGFGAGALAKTNSGSDNTAVGQGALTENLSGANNTAVGQGALTSNQNGTSNVAIGQASLRAIVNTDRNTAIGRAAIENITSGADNTVLGYIAGRNHGSTFTLLTSNITSSLSQSVMLGAYSRPSASGSQNEIVIGYDAFGAGNNSVQLGNTSVTKVNTSGSMNATKFIGNNAGSLPTIDAFNTTILGTAISPTISGNDVAGFITFTTGAGPSTVGDFITVRFGSAYLGSNPVVIIQPVSNTAPRGIATSIYCLPSSTSLNTFTISTGSTLSISTEYQIAYHVIGRQ